MDNTSAERGSAEIDELQWGSLRDWVELVRMPALFTLLSNCLAASCVSTGWLTPLSAFIPVLLASVAAYWAGMILNDVADQEEDARFRPTRPLVSGKISPTVAGHVASGMLLVVPIVVLGVTAFHKSDALQMGAAFVAAVLLVLSIRAYNSVLKRTPVGPVLMGACRALNILMVGFTLLSVSPDAEIPKLLIGYAASVGIYVIGITVYASREETGSSQSILGLGVVIEIAGLVILAMLPRWSEKPTWTLDPLRGYPLLVGLVGLTVLNRGMSGILRPNSRTVQLAVKHALLTIVLLDAAVVLMWSGPWPAAGTALLLVPALASAMRVRTT